MKIGAGIFLLVVGGILAFGIQDRWDVVNLTAIGYICMAVGVLAIIISLVVSQQRRSTRHTARIERDDEPPLR